MTPLIIDSREPKRLQLLIKGLLTDAKVERLEVGDFSWWDSNSEPVIVTRKAGDAMASVFSGHFNEELDGIGAFLSAFPNGHLVWLLEGPWASVGKNAIAHFKRTGTWFRQSTSHNASIRSFMGLQAGMVAANIPIVHTTSNEETAIALEMLYKRSMDGWPTNLTRGLKRPNLRWSWQQDNSTKKIQRLMALWPRLPEPVAHRLMEQFDSISNIMSVLDNNPDHLKIVKGVGKVLVDNLKEVVE